jgi:hypothetical protein
MSSIARNASVRTGFCPNVPNQPQVPDQQEKQDRVPKHGNSRSANTSDAEKLADCNGVLTPPSTGDRDRIKPAPKQQLVELCGDV